MADKIDSSKKRREKGQRVIQQRDITILNFCASINTISKLVKHT